MQVRIIDLMAFYKDRIARNEKAIVKRDYDYEIAKVEYESNFLNKLFRWKYKDSIGNHRYTWQYPFEDHIKNYEGGLAALEYQSKMQYTLVDLPKEQANNFYKFAQENSLPY